VVHDGYNIFFEKISQIYAIPIATQTVIQFLNDPLTIMAAYLPFNRVEDFIAGQTCADGSAVEWIVAARIRGIKWKDLKLILILSIFIMNVHLDRKTIQESSTPSFKETWMHC
jgi:hypothetical protein